MNEKRIRHLMRLMGLMPVYQKPNTSKAAKWHKTYPCLLRGLRAERTQPGLGRRHHYLPMRCGFLYLAAIMDWHTRKVLAWRISNPLEVDFCVEALNEAIHRFGPPEIMNTDPRSQFMSFVWTDPMRRSGVRISPSHACKHALPGQWMDGKGRLLPSRDIAARYAAGQRINIFVERLRRSLKYECVYLHAIERGSEAKIGIRNWLAYYNTERRHST